MSGLRKPSGMVCTRRAFLFGELRRPPIGILRGIKEAMAEMKN
jgi:hypothetical protein